MATGHYGQHGNYFADYAERYVYQNFGDVVSILDKGKTLSKFGRTEQASGSISTVWGDVGALNETYVSTNIIDTVSSSAVADTGANRRTSQVVHL